MFRTRPSATHIFPRLWLGFLLLSTDPHKILGLKLSMLWHHVPYELPVVHFMFESFTPNARVGFEAKILKLHRMNTKM